MVPRILYLHPKTYKRLIRLRKQAERDGAYRVAKRLQAVVLNSEGRTSGELAHLLGSPRSRVSEWLARYQTFGVEGLLEGHRSGRPLELTSAQRKQLGSLRPGYGHLDLSHDRLGHRGGIRHSLSSRPCAQVAPSFGLLGAASASRAGPSQRGPARSLAALHLSQS